MGRLVGLLGAQAADGGRVTVWLQLLAPFWESCRTTILTGPRTQPAEKVVKRFLVVLTDYSWNVTECSYDELLFFHIMIMNWSAFQFREWLGIFLNKGEHRGWGAGHPTHMGKNLIFDEKYRVVGIQPDRLLLRGVRSGDVLTILNSEPEIPLTLEEYPLGKLIALTDPSLSAMDWGRSWPWLYCQVLLAKSSWVSAGFTKDYFEGSRSRDTIGTTPPKE
jgi:hypothetical protein